MEKIRRKLYSIKLRIWKEIDFILFCSIIKIGKEKREGKDNPSFIFL